MRVIAGIYKSRLLRFPKAEGVRPTQDRVKESMFEILKPYLAGADVLDLFAGSGALGIEALSRGAKSVVFVENDHLCIKTIEENLAALDIDAIVIRSDVFKAFSRFSQNNDKFGIVIADPPYGWGLEKKLLIRLNECDILRQPHLVIIEHSKKDLIPSNEGNIILYKQYKYADTVLSVYRLVYEQTERAP